MPSVTIVGAFPPPRHGVSAVNEALSSAFTAAGVEVVRNNTAASSLDRRLHIRVQRMGRIFNAIRDIIRRQRVRPNQICYFPLSGGFGLLYECVLILVAKYCRASVVVHHHSFRYLDKPFWPMRLLVRIAGPLALHVTLGRQMSERLRLLYPLAGRVMVVSNAGFIAQREGIAPHTKPIKAGFLSNLSTAKGLDDFLELAEMSAARNLPWHFVLAGPFENAADKTRYMAIIQRLPNLDYQGPLYGDAKKAFFQEIDIFIFPTRYQNEAEPLVILEALSNGLPVIAFGRGCIPDMLAGDSGLSIPIGEEFVARALARMEEWRQEGEAFARRSASARKRFEELRIESSNTLKVLLEQMTDTRQ